MLKQGPHAARLHPLMQPRFTRSLWPAVVRSCSLAVYFQASRRQRNKYDGQLHSVDKQRSAWLPAHSKGSNRGCSMGSSDCPGCSNDLNGDDSCMCFRSKVWHNDHLFPLISCRLGPQQATENTVRARAEALHSVVNGR